MYIYKKKFETQGDTVRDTDHVIIIMGNKCLVNRDVSIYTIQ